MKPINFFRIIKFGFQNFFRNFWLSAATVSILVLTLVSINVLVVMNVLSKIAVATIESKVDVSVHFRPEVEERRVQTVKVALVGMREVRDVIYVSPEENLSKFKEQNNTDTDLVASLNEIETNPFGATLIVKARDVKDYPVILQMLSQPMFASLIEEKDFADRETMTARLDAITNKIQLTMLGVSGLFGLIALLIIINTIRVSIFTHKEEIAIMRLVGASNWMIRGPFYVEALIWTLASITLALAIVLPTVYFCQPFLQSFLGTNSIDLILFYKVNALKVVGLQALAVAIMTIVTSKIATAKYLKI